MRKLHAGKTHHATTHDTTHDTTTAPEVTERREVRAAVARFLTVGFLALVLVATPVAFWIRAEAEQHALANARDITQRLADNVVGPLITNQLLAREPAVKGCAIVSGALPFDRSHSRIPFPRQGGPALDVAVPLA
ncbi:hypothetical protein [Arthrobacter burdickii]|uniref:Sensor histidine kinase n=1 Tax=Arthrobacter burdickii TaxID=3035920 RepID=A0ABT8K306_9MICC|nr:hypothetical protein [Arthrobacter burdickii]MDN4611805.1 hypothetical protein [Arthrobacter burdickii]